MTIETIDTVSIDASDRARVEMGDIADLAESIERFGLIQPIIVNQDRKLVAGGRRLAAVRLLGLPTVEVAYRETMTEDELLELELEENVRRKDMTWQERVKAIARIHKTKRRDAVTKGIDWLGRHTAELLNVGEADVSTAVRIAAELEKDDANVRAASSFTEAVRMLLKTQEERARRRAMELTGATSPRIVTGKVSNETDDEDEDDDGPKEPPVDFSFDWDRQLVVGDVLKIGDVYEDGYFQHIITDPPYAINMDNLKQDAHGIDNIDAVRAEHDVRENLDMLAEFCSLAYRKLDDHGFLIMWTDYMTWQWLYESCIEVGFSVQRWPLVWVKTHRCLNQAAHFNFTKDTEIAIVARKKDARLVRPQGTSVMVEEGLLDKKILGGHPFVKPHKLWRWLYWSVAHPGDRVWDPFCGVGSSFMSSVPWLQWHGCEVKQEWADLARQNVEHYIKLVMR